MSTKKFRQFFTKNRINSIKIYFLIFLCALILCMLYFEYKRDTKINMGLVNVDENFSALTAEMDMDSDEEIVNFSRNISYN